MSYTTILAIWPGDKVIKCEPLIRNAHGSAPVVWSAMCKRYFGDELLWMLDNDCAKLWELWTDLSIPKAHRAVLMMTFDHAYITKKDYMRAAGDIFQFQLDFPAKSNVVNNWENISLTFRAWASWDESAPALGIWQTSVTVNPFQGRWNEEAQDYDPFDWSQTYDIYDHLDWLEKERQND